MVRGFPSHIDLTVSDVTRSTLFYDRILSELGYSRVVYEKTETPCWVISDGSGNGFSIALQPAKTKQHHDRYATGLHHLAFHMSSREDVDQFYAYLIEHNINILDKPAEYDYTSGYYAVFFLDPDGIKLEAVYEPNFDFGSG